MTINELQQATDNWIRTYGVRYFNELTNMALLTEEVGEIARIMARLYGEQSSKDSDLHLKLADELADAIFVIVCIANQTGINLNEAIRNNFKKKSERDKDRHQNNLKLKQTK